MSEDLNQEYSPREDEKKSSGPFIARVVSCLDPEYMGALEVEILRPSGADTINGTADGGQTHRVKYMSPFTGNTPDPTTGSSNDYTSTQQTYGFWFVPPDPGSLVIVFFIDGNPKYGYWIGSVNDNNMNFMIPGNAATQNTVESGTADSKGRQARLPTGEYNKGINGSDTPGDPENIKKPKGPLADILTSQGLVLDDTRGITTSSARREVPSMVFGISTPGPLDKRSGARQGPQGKGDSQVPNAYLSRLGGTTFVMDDGDAAFLRKTPASSGPPDYASVEVGESGGNPAIPHNELVRIRTRTGHQILLHNSEDLIYIGNAKGTTWIELTSNGKIDIYAKDSISVHTENDLNFTADRDINFNANGDINLNSAGNNNFTTKGATNINSAKNHVETAAQIHMNGPAAAKANQPVRVPQHEPWNGHENLDPTAVTPAKTKAVAAPKAPANPAFFKEYTTATDTFTKYKGNTAGPGDA
jgi:hypothetical protein